MKKPWYYAARKGWYIFVDRDGKRSKLRMGDTQKEAYDKWRRLLAKQEQHRNGDATFAEILEAYLEWALNEVRNGDLSSRTLENYGFYLDRFSQIAGETLVSELAPKHVTDWLAENPSWGPSAQRKAIISLNRVLNWALSEKRIGENPLSRMKKPSQPRRDALVDVDAHQKMLMAIRSSRFAGKIDRQFQLVLIALRHCGGRPQDVSNVRVEHVRDKGSAWQIPEHKNRRHTEQPKTVYCSPCLQTITKILSHTRSSGPLFRGRRGRLTVNAITCRVKRLREQLKLPLGTVAYSYRHSYITDALERGVDIATVAELVGTSVTMIQRHYGHLENRSDHLSLAARKAVAMD